MSTSERLPAETGRVSRDAPARRLANVRSRRGPLVRRALVAADVVALLVAFTVAKIVSTDSRDLADQLLGLVLLLPVWLLGAKLYGLYDRHEHRADHSTVEEVTAIVQFVTLFTWIGLVAAWVIDLEWTLPPVIAFWAAGVVTLVAGRGAARAVVRRRPAYVQNALIVGAGDVGQLVGRKLVHHPELGIRLVGFVDSDPKSMRTDLDGVPLLGEPSDIVELVRRHDVHRVVVAFSNDRHDQMLDLVRTLRGLDVQIDVVPRLFEAVGPAVGMHAVEGLPLVGLPPVRISRTGRLAKRGLDVALASLTLVLLSPLFLWIAWRIRSDSHGPVLFRQTRLGEQMRPFTLLKFRTMREATDEGPHREYIAQIMDPGVAPTHTRLYKLDRPDAVTKVGGWLRRTSLDELPQLFNVLRGEMSLVGPRPCIAYETDVLEPHHFDRFLVPAGMTGLWQVAARANSTFREALDLDAAYARNWSLGLDLRLLARTPFVVIRGRRGTS